MSNGKAGQSGSAAAAAAAAAPGGDDDGDFANIICCKELQLLKTVLGPKYKQLRAGNPTPPQPPQAAGVATATATATATADHLASHAHTWGGQGADPAAALAQGGSSSGG